MRERLSKAIGGFITRHRTARYVFVLTVWPFVAIADRARRIRPPAALARGLHWARTGEDPSAPKPRPAPARVTTPAERAPLYAAYAAARAKAAEVGADYHDDGIVQAAVKAYETEEIARLRREVETLRDVARGNKRHVAEQAAIIQRVEDLIIDTDRGDLGGDEMIPVRRIREALYAPIPHREDQ